MERCANNRAAAVVAQPAGRRRWSPLRPRRRRREAHRGSVGPAVVAPESVSVERGERGEVCVLMSAGTMTRVYALGAHGPRGERYAMCVAVRRVIQLLALLSPDGDGCSMLCHVCACDEATHTARARIYACARPFREGFARNECRCVPLPFTAHGHSNLFKDAK